MDAWVEKQTKRENKVRTKKEIYILVGWISATLFIIFMVVFIIISVFSYIRCMMNETSPVQELRPEWYGLKFPENIFVVPSDYLSQYTNRVEIGRNAIVGKKFIVCGLVRDIFPKLKENLQRIRAMFLDLGIADYKIVIFENDSKDGSREYLEWEASRKGTDLELVPCFEDCFCRLKTVAASSHGAESLARVEKMAYFRNRLLSYIKDRYSHYDYLFNFDFDMSGPMSWDGFAHNFSFSGWDMMATYSVMDAPILGAFIYYDSFAFESIKGSYDATIKNNMLNTIMFRRDRGMPPVPVLSAFGGAAVYSMNSIMESRALYYSYKGRCEHVGFHKSMVERGFRKLFVNPSWVTLQTPPSFIHLEKQ